MKLVSSNRKAYHDYAIEDTFETGIALSGTEVKSLREGKVNFKDSYVLVKAGEAFLIGCHISPYSHGNRENHDPERTRKLLLHRKEIDRIGAAIAQKGYTLVPLKIYFKGPWVKVEIGLAKGKRVFEKREAIKEREAKREVRAAMKARSR